MTKRSQADIVLGELVGGRSTEPAPIPCEVPGVVARQTRTTGKGITVENRLYKCPNGLAMAARRGAPLHLADADSWEVTVLSPEGIVTGASVGWVSEDELLRGVQRLADWRPAAEVSA